MGNRLCHQVAGAVLALSVGACAAARHADTPDDHRAQAPTPVQDAGVLAPSLTLFDASRTGGGTGGRGVREGETASPTVSAVERIGPQLVPNASLEQPSDDDPTMPRAWHTGSYGDHHPTFVYADNGHSGAHSARVTIADYVSGEARWYFDPQPVTPGGRYAYSDYYKASVPSELTARFTLRDGSFQYVSLSECGPADDYTELSVAFEVPANATQLTMFHSIAANGTLQIDDASLNALAAVAAVGGVLNGDMEREAFPGADAPAGWHRNVWGTNDAKLSYVNEGHSGSHSVRVDVGSYTSGSASWYPDELTLTPGMTYRIGEFYRSNVDTLFQALVRFTDGSSQYVQLPSVFLSPNWKEYSANLVVPQNAAGITLYHQVKAVGYLQTDDLTVRPAEVLPFRRALVSLTFDDSWSSDYDAVLPILTQKGVTSTHYVISGDLDQSGRLSWAQVYELQARGREIASHTVSHPDLTTLSGAALSNELVEAKRRLEADGLGTMLDFASPYGAYNGATIAAIRAAGYASHRSTDVGYNTKSNFDFYNLKVQNIRSDTTAAEVAGWAAEAVRTKSWLILVYHDVVDPTPSIYGATPENLAAHVDALKSAGVTFVTVRQALVEIEPQLGAR